MQVEGCQPSDHMGSGAVGWHVYVTLALLPTKAWRSEVTKIQKELSARRRKWNGTTTRKGKRQVKRREERDETRV